MNKIENVEPKGRKDSADQKNKKANRKVSEYGRQLQEKQLVKRTYGMRERQFKRFFENAVRMKGAPGENLLSMLECRLDNAFYRLKMAASRVQARQLITHGHVMVNGGKVYSPSYLVTIGDEISLDPAMIGQTKFIEQVIDKRLKLGIKTPDWLELDKKNYKGRVLRAPVREDLQTPVQDHLIVELYSK